MCRTLQTAGLTDGEGLSMAGHARDELRPVARQTAAHRLLRRSLRTVAPA